MSDLIILSDLIIYPLVISCVAGSSTIELVCFVPRQRAFWETVGFPISTLDFRRVVGDLFLFFLFKHP